MTKAVAALSILLLASFAEQVVLLNSIEFTTVDSREVETPTVGETVSESDGSWTYTSVIETSTLSLSTYVTDVSPSCSDPPALQINATALNSTAIKVCWYMSECVYGNMTQYIVNVKTDRSDECVSKTNKTFNVSVSETCLIYTEAKPNTNYEVSVSGETEGGTGPANTTTVLTKEEASPAPLINATALNSTAIKVCWNMSECVYGNMTQYIVNVKTDRSDECVSKTNKTFNVSVSETCLIYTEAKPNTNYEVSVSGETGGGMGPANTTTVLTKEEAPPAPQINATALNSTAIKVCWNMSECVYGNMTQYIVNVKTDRSDECVSKTNKTFNVSVSETCLIYTEAKPNTNYEVSVSGETGGGMGPANTTTVLTEEEAPPAPLINATALNSTAIKVCWNMSECVYGNMTQYIVNVKTDRSDECVSKTNKTFNVSVSETCLIYTEAKPNTNYKVSVSGETGGGMGPANTTTVLTKEEAPPAPQINATALNSTAIKVCWYMSECVYGNMTQYIVNVKTDRSDECMLPLVENIHVSVSETCLIYSKAEANTNYEVCVSGETGGGMGPANTTTVLTEEEVPPAPHVVTVEGKRSIRVTWNYTSICVPGHLQMYNVCVIPLGYKGNGSCDPKTEEPFCTQLPSSKTEHDFTNLQPFSFYEVHVSASTGAGQGYPKINNVITYEDEPDAVRDLHVTGIQANSSHANIKWKMPCTVNGIIGHYQVHLNGSRKDLAVPHELKKKVPPDQTSFYYVDLRADYVYLVTVTTVTKSENVSGKKKEIEFHQPAMIPTLNKSFTEVQLDTQSTEDSSSQVLVKFFPCLFDPKQGQILHFAVLMSEKSMEAESGIMNSSNCATWTPRNNEYQPTPLCWKPFTGNACNNLRTAEKDAFTVGNNRSCKSNHCNGPLKPSTGYYIKLRVYTAATYADTPVVFFQTDNNLNAGMIAGVVFAILFAGIIAVLFVMHRSGKLSWLPVLQRKTTANVRPPPIALKKFPEHCNQMLDIPARLSNEYQLLATLSVDIASTESFTAGQLPDNKRKNRYINILPYDSTRVKLESIEGDSSSDYINASFIKGYSSDIEYIASQGPKEETCSDFWHMIYQQGVKVIVMVTQFEEQGKIKCYKYFPNLRENIIYGDITVRCTTELHFAIYTSRTLILLKDDRKRTIVHLHFREWPDFGCPASTDVMLQFCQVVRHHSMLCQPGLTLVHCSAGVGRTGTLIAVDILLQHIKENKKVDIFGTVYKLRKQRINMVQSEAQYIYVYKCVKDALEDPSYLQPEKSSTSSMEPIYENVTSNLNSILYEKVPESKTKTNSSESECEL